MIRKFPGHDVVSPPGTVTWSDCPEPLTNPQGMCYTIGVDSEKEKQLWTLLTEVLKLGKPIQSGTELKIKMR